MHNVLHRQPTGRCHTWCWGEASASRDSLSFLPQLRIRRYPNVCSGQSKCTLWQVLSRRAAPWRTVRGRGRGSGRQASPPGAERPVVQNWSIAWKRACRATRDCAGIAAYAATAGTPPVLQRIAASMHRHHRAHRHAAALLERRSCDPKGVRYLGSIVETSVRRKRDFGAIGSIAGSAGTARPAPRENVLLSSRLLEGPAVGRGTRPSA